FSYLGQVDQAGGGSGNLFGVAVEKAGEARSRRGERQHVLEVSGIVVGEELQMSWGYSENLHERGRIEELAGLYEEELEALIESSDQQEERSFIPSDFLDVVLTQE